MPIPDQERGKDRPGEQTCKFLPLGGNDLAGCQLAGRPTSEKTDLGVLADNKLEKTQQCALEVEKDNPTLGWVCRSRAVIIPLYSGLAKETYLCTGELQTSD